MGNAYRIFVKIALFDTEFILLGIKTTNSKKQRLLAEKWQFSRKNSKFSHFGQNAKGQFWPIFIAWLPKLRKIANTYRIFMQIALFDAQFIVIGVKPNTSKKQRLVAEK